MIKIALIGKKAAGKTFSACYLRKNHGFKKIRMDDAITKFMRVIYVHKKNERPSWERRLDIYDALYNIDPSIHIGYITRRLATTTNDVVIEDARYVSELQVLKEQGFVIVRIAAPDDRRKRRIGNMVRKAGAGTLVLQEFFNENKTIGYSADYSIYNENRDATKRSLDELIDNLRKERV